MVQPFQYMTGAQDPVAALQSGMAFGQQQRAGEQAIDMNAQSMDLRAADEARAQEAFGQQNLLFDQQQQERTAAMEKAKAMQDDFVAVAERLSRGDAGFQDFAALATKYPDVANEAMSMWEGVSAERKDADVANLFKGITAIKAGRPDLAAQMLEDRAVAAENAGDQKEADIARAMAAAIEADPNAGLTSLGFLLQVVDPDAALTVFGEAPELTASQKDYKFYEKQETDAGRKPLSFNEWDLQGKKAGAASTTVTVGGEGEATAGEALKATRLAAQSALDDIDAIMDDPALEGVTGAIEGGGGNDVDQFNMAQRAYYGDAGLAVIQRIYQAQNNNFLAARELLKGAGQVTDFEGRKAEAAMARLSRAQGYEEFKAALQDLRDAITDGIVKMEEAGLIEAGGSGSPPGSGGPSLDDLLREAEGLAP